MSYAKSLKILRKVIRTRKSIYKTLHIKLKIAQHEPHLRPVISSCSKSRTRRITLVTNPVLSYEVVFLVADIVCYSLVLIHVNIFHCLLFIDSRLIKLQYIAF